MLKYCKNSIRQFVTILSVNKTRDWMGALRPFLFFQEHFMRNNIRSMAHGAIIAALYTVLTHFQNIIFPNSASMAVQFRGAEALCVLAFFTPAAMPGLTVGCFLFNVTSGAALPLDFLAGSLATAGAGISMWKCRNLTIKGYPLPGLLMPAAWNAVLVGWELSHYIGGGFWLNALWVAVGELAVLLTLGTVLYYTVKKHRRHLGL